MSARLRPFYRELDKIVPVGLGVTIVLSVALFYFMSWTMHNDSTQRIRLSELNHYTTQFRSSPIVDSWARITEILYIEQHRYDVLRSRVDENLEVEKTRHVRNYQQHVLDMVDDYSLQTDVKSMHQFFNRLTLCVRTGGCEQVAAANLFGTPLQQFYARFGYYFEYAGMENDADMMQWVILLP